MHIHNLETALPKDLSDLPFRPLRRAGHIHHMRRDHALNLSLSLSNRISAIYNRPPSNPLQLAGIHRVVGLQQCLEENGYRGLVGKDRESLVRIYDPQ